MKIRNGFVSNSSSSSFVIRGVKLKIVDVAKRLKEDPTQDDLFDVLSDRFDYGKGKVNCESARCFFDGESHNTADVIVGVQVADLDDGNVVEIKDPDDIRIRKKIEGKVGKIGNLKTYAQYISNDNY